MILKQSNCSKFLMLMQLFLFYSCKKELVNSKNLESSLPAIIYNSNDSIIQATSLDSSQYIGDTLIGPLKVKLNPKDYVYGLDISHIQGSKIDWSKLRESNLKFIYIKLFDPAWVGTKFRKRDRLNYYDRALAQSIGAKENNFKIGYYLYCRPPSSISISVKEHAENQACMFLDRIYFHKYDWNVSPDFPLVLDFESHDNEKTVNKKNALLLNDWLLEIANTLELNGYKVMIYSNKHSVELGLPIKHSFSNYPYWTAGYPKFHITNFPKKYQLPGWSDDWMIWQFSDVFLIDGICNNDYINKFKDLNSIIEKYHFQIANARALFGSKYKDSIKVLIGRDPDNLPYCDINIMKRNFFNSH